MNIKTRREFTFKNPQDDPDLYPPPPPGFQYDFDGSLMEIPRNYPSEPPSGIPPNHYGEQKRDLCNEETKIKDIRKLNDLLDHEGFLQYVANVFRD